MQIAGERFSAYDVKLFYGARKNMVGKVRRRSPDKDNVGGCGAAPRRQVAFVANLYIKSFTASLSSSKLIRQGLYSENEVDWLRQKRQ